MLMLISSSESTTYARRFCETLRSEGYRSIETCALETVTQEQLYKAPTVILPHQTECRAACRDRCLEYVAGGGTLVAFLPSDALCRSLGIRTTGATLPGATLQVPVAGATSASFPISLPFASWHAESADVLLWCTDDGQPRPAAFRIRYGGGTVLAFAFDVAKLLAQTPGTQVHPVSGRGAVRVIPARRICSLPI